MTGRHDAIVIGGGINGLTCATLLAKNGARAQWALWSHWLIWHGRRRCTARKPDCAGCEVAKLCPSAGKA